MKTKKNQLAKFGVYKIHESGADELFTARRKDGKPIMKFSEAVERKQQLHDAGNNLNLIVRAI